MDCSEIWNTDVEETDCESFDSHNGGNVKLSPACLDGIQGCGAIAVLILKVNVDGGEW